MGILLCEQNFRDVWILNKSVRVEIGQILHTDTHPHTHTTAAKLVVRLYIYTIIGRSLVNICKGLEPRECRSMNARSRPFLPNDGP